VNTWKVILATLVIFVAGIVTGGVMVGFGARTKERFSRQYEKNEKPRPGREFSNAPVGMNPGGNPGARDPQRPLNLPRNPQARFSQDFVEKLHAEVQLTEGQRERIQEVITDGQQRNKEIMERVTPDLRREMMETQKRIRHILTEPQLVKFDELMKQRQPRPQGEPGRPGNMQRRPQPDVQAKPNGSGLSPDEKN
jgi:Spy/CpxP family protein refolding chaperone